MPYLQELDALQRLLWVNAQLKSHRLEAAPPEIARPCVLWEAPQRNRDSHIGRYEYANQVTQYGKLYAKDLVQLIGLQDALQRAVEGNGWRIPVYADGQAAALVVGHLLQPEIYFDRAPDSSLDVPFYIRYRVQLTRADKPAPPGPVVTVYQRQGPQF